MLSFATEFPISHSRRTADFLESIRTWVLGSPHTQLGADDLGPILEAGESHIQKANERIDTLLAATAENDTAAVKYTRRDHRLEWATSIVFSRTRSDSWVGIGVTCESKHPAARLPPAKKPVVVRTLLNDLGGGFDGRLTVGDVPIALNDSDIDIAKGLINGTSGCRLPIIYVSAGFQGQHLIDGQRMASDLTGMAHVVVEPNRAFSLRLKIEVDSDNVYGGTIGIYWPNGGGRRSFFLGGEFDSADELYRAVIDEVRSALTNKRPLDRCTWAYVQETASRQAIESLRAAGSRDLDKYIDTFDKELAAKDQRFEAANKEIARLQAELRIYESRLAVGAVSLLRAGDEQDLFPNEVVGIVRDAIEDAVTRVPADSRRKHVLEAILQANPSVENASKSKKDALKDLLRGSKSVDAKVRRGLEEMGFTVSADGKHYKIVFQGDDRYTFTLPKSGSDHRGGLNAASDISRLLF